MLSEFMLAKTANQLQLISKTDKTLLYPLLQVPDANVLIDEIVTKLIFEKAAENSSINLGTGYFNLTKEYQDLIILKNKSRFNILVSSPEANGFYNANGIAKYIPKVYSHIEEGFYKQCALHSQSSRINMFEYTRDAWTFHVKGLWYYPPNKTLPSLTLIGSSNFGYRSVNRDVECQIALLTTNKELQTKLDEVRQQ
jgi:CDP-diacylglycerol--glycerol-3-phosphate 3-phosphatidyltransferase